MEDKRYSEILEENERRWTRLSADYNPVTGDGLEGRVRLEIPDFAIPVQFVPERMLDNDFIHALTISGSIRQFLLDYPDDPMIDSHDSVEKEILKIRFRYDFPFWAYYCFPILAKTGGEVRFKLNYPQLELDGMVQAQQDEEGSIDVVICKARQWGGSTYSIAKQTHILFNLDKFHSFAVAAHVQGAAENILRMLKHAIKNYPVWALGLSDEETIELLPAGKSGNAYAIKDSKGNQVLPGLIYIGSAQYPDSLRSPAVMGVHLSEVGVWPDTPERRPQDLISTLCGGLIGRPLEMQITESTAKSSDDFFHDVYIAAKQVGRAIFIPWFHIPHDTKPVRNRRKFIKELLEHKDDDKPYGKWKDSGRHYWWLWTLGATLEGINWYMYKRLDPKILSYASMANEAPSTDIEAFQAAGNHVFDIYQVEELRKFCRTPYKVGDLYSNDRRDRGVLKDIHFIEKANGNLKIWEMPDTESNISHRYMVAVDIGGPNATSDFHSVRVFDRFMMMDGINGVPSVVAEMHYHCKRDDLVFDAIRLSEWYNHALLVIESNTMEMTDKNRDVGGDGSQYVLDVAADIYSNLYTRESSPEEIKEGAPTKYGFQTNAKTKPRIIDFAQWAISEKGWLEPCENTIDEFAMYIEDKPNHFTAPAHKHDDELMATCIGLWICYKEMPLPRWIEETKKHNITTKANLATF